MHHRKLVGVPLDRTPLSADLRALGPLELHEVSTDPALKAVLETLLAEEHYLGYRSAVGENLKYLLCTPEGRPVAVWSFGASAWRCQVRDARIGWSDSERAKGLTRVMNNTRFLIPTWIRVPGLASWGWGRVRRRLVGDWQAKYGHRIELVESFVDRSRFRGSCYAASNWTEGGADAGTRPWRPGPAEPSDGEGGVCVPLEPELSGKAPVVKEESTTEQIERKRAVNPMVPNLF
jgi:hypothetical protein